MAISEESLAELEALSRAGSQRAELLDPLNIRLFAHMERKGHPGHARMLMNLKGWGLLADFKKKVADFKRTADETMRKKREDEEVAARLEEAREAGRPLIPAGKPVNIAANFVKERRPHLVYLGDEWLDYVGNCYESLTDKHVRSLAQAYCASGVDEETGEDHVTMRRELDDVMDALRNLVFRDKGTYKPPSWLESDGTEPDPRMTLACANGLLDVMAQDLMKPSWTFFTRNGLEYDYTPGAECPTWLAFLRESWGGDTAPVEALQEMFGYLLSGDTSHQKIFMIVGPSRSGKGTINRVLTALVGANNVASHSLMNLAGDFGLMGLVGKSLFTVPDMRWDKGAATGKVVEILLNISGEDRVGVNVKFKDPILDKLNTRIVLFGNMELALPDKAGALSRRLVPIVMDRQVDEDEEDTKLTDRLLEELPGILLWALEGLRRLTDRGHFVLTPAGRKLLRGINLHASPVHTFVTECCRVGDEFDRVSLTGLFKTYESFLKENGVTPWQKLHHFEADIRTVNRRVDVEWGNTDDNRRARYFTHLALKPELEGRVWESDEEDDGL